MAEPPPAERIAQPALDEALAATGAERRANAFLRALTALHEHGDLKAAAQIVSTVRSAEIDGKPLLDALSAAARFRFDALALQLLLANDPPADSGTLAEAARALVPTDASQQRLADELVVFAFANAADHASAVLALMDVAERGLYTDTETLAGHLWRHLSRLPLPTLARIASAMPSPRAQWLRLAHDLNAALSHAEQVRIWQRWRTTHGEHIAVRLPPPALEQTSPAVQLALLLPFSGDLAAFAEAIRDGFLAAYLQTLQALHEQPMSAAHRQVVRFYDTGALSIDEAYRRARADGADVIVGPLEKAAVAELAALSPTLPVLALNSLDDGAAAASNFLQLPLAVEDAAAAIASALQADGVQRIVLFDNQQAWSPRAKARLRTELEGIEVAATATLADLGNVLDVAGEALGVAASVARHETLSRLLREELVFLPRRRQDVDAVVALVDGTQLMALKPALEFHFAGDLPIYGPSQAVRGAVWRQLDGMRVCTIPWLVQASAMRSATTVFESSDDPLLASLFALGVDAYRIVNQRARLTALGESIAGSVGQLTLSDNGRIRRELYCGTIADGRLTAAAPAS